MDNKKESVFMVYETYSDGCAYEESLGYEGVRLEEDAFRTYEEALTRCKDLQEKLIDKVRKERLCEDFPDEDVQYGIEDGYVKDVHYVAFDNDYWTFYPVEIVIN